MISLPVKWSSYRSLVIGLPAAVAMSFAVMGAASSCSSSGAEVVDSGPSDGGGDSSQQLPDAHGFPGTKDGGGLGEASCAESDEHMCDRLGVQCGALIDKDLCQVERNVVECGPCTSETEACEKGACVKHAVAWVPSKWSKCSKSCGGGTQTRTLSCVRDDDVPMSDAACAGVSKPATSQKCNTQACCTPHCAPAKACGDDGCGHSCGSCAAKMDTYPISCIKGVCTWVFGTSGTNYSCNDVCPWGHGAPCLWVKSSSIPNATCSTHGPNITCYCREP